MTTHITGIEVPLAFKNIEGIVDIVHKFADQPHEIQGPLIKGLAKFDPGIFVATKPGHLMTVSHRDTVDSSIALPMDVITPADSNDWRAVTPSDLPYQHRIGTQDNGRQFFMAHLVRVNLANRTLVAENLEGDARISPLLKNVQIAYVTEDMITGTRPLIV